MLSELFNEELIKLLKNLKDTDYSFKVNMNGEPVVDIENGMDKLNPCKKPHDDEVVCGRCGKNPCVCDSPNPTETGPIDNLHPEMVGPEAISKYVTMFDNDCYSVNTRIGNYQLDDRNEINFAKFSNGVLYPGVTEEDLLWILAYRFRENKDLFDKVMEVIKAL